MQPQRIHGVADPAASTTTASVIEDAVYFVTRCVHPQRLGIFNTRTKTVTGVYELPRASNARDLYTGTDDTSCRLPESRATIDRGHPISMAAVSETIRLLKERDVPAQLDELYARIVLGIDDCIKDVGVTATVKRYGGVWMTYFMNPPIRYYDGALGNDVEAYERYWYELID